MDPLSIAAGAAGLAVSCGTIVKTLYDWIHDTVDVDENISSLCDEVTTLSRVLESISNTSVQVPVAVTVEIDPDNGLWGSLQTTLDDVKGTFEKLNQLLAELEKSSSFFSRGFLRKPRKQIRFSLRLKEISICKERIKSYNTAMTSALQMLNICLLIQSNSSQDSVVNLLSGLKSQLRRVESALQTRSYLSSGESSAEDIRISRNLRHFVQIAETFHSSASTIIEDRSTVWEGSILGEPLTQAQTSRIEEWIPPPLSEEDFTQQNSIADESSRGDAISGDAEGLHSDSGSDIDKDLTKRLEDLAIQNLRSGEYAKAEQFYRSVIDRGEASHRPFHYVTDMRVQLAYAVMRQGKWIEAEEIMAPIAFQKRVNDVLVYHGMHAIAMIHLRNYKLEAADRCCKRALWGKRKALGKESASCWDTLALLASICAAKNEVAEAEAHRSFIPPTYQVMTDTDALAYLDRTVARDQTASALLYTAEAGLPSCQTSSALRRDDPELISSQPSAIPPIQLTPTSQFIVSQPPTPSQNVVEPGNPRHEFSDIRPSQIIRGTCSAAVSSLHQRFPLSEETTQAEVTCPTTPNLFVGIYYGTVHCAVAYSTKTSVPRDVDVITKWIDSSAYTKPTVCFPPDIVTFISYAQVPAVIYYDQYQNVVGWGHDVTEALDPEGCPKPGVHKVDWIKLYLEIVGNRLDPNSLPPLPPGKNAIDVSADYLLKLRLATQALLLETLGNAFLQERAQIHWCFTIPRTWGQSMKAALQTAIERAGYLQAEHETRLSLFPQTETSVLHCLKTHLITLQQTDAFIVVDCPKGIVDLSAYEMVAEAPFTLTELTTGSQGTCGSLAVSRNFRHMLRKKMEKMKLPDDHKNAGRIYVTATREFENQIKPRFHDSGQKWLIDVGTETDYPEADIKDGYMIFTNEEILSCFRPATTRILEMVSHQIYQVWNLNKFIRAVVVTGEFASSDFVFGQIKHHILARRQINVARSADALLARVKGAVMTGISRSPANPRVRAQTLGRIVQ